MNGELNKTIEFYNVLATDLNPYTSAAGGMISDALKEVDMLKKSEEEKAEIRVRCRHCRELNEEDARYCKSCGKEM